jgi:transcriptional regulator with XRE-family HTH domain
MQWPHVDYPNEDNLRMGKARETAARNLARLMESSRLDTLQKVADKSGVGYGTVRRVKLADVSVTIDNLEAIAAAFGLSLVEFLADADATPVERTCRDVAHMLAALPEADRAQIVTYVTLRTELRSVTPDA